jgi:hypothetical protein
MTITHIRTAIVGAAALAMVFLGTGTAQAVPDELPTQRTCPSCRGFDPQPDPPGYPDLNNLPSVRGFDPQPDPPGTAPVKLGP